MKKYLLTALAVLAVAGFTCAQDISQARKDYSSRLYNKAAEGFAPSADGLGSISLTGSSS